MKTPDPTPSHPDRWLGVVTLAAVVLLSAAACYRKIWAADFWWQYRTGRYVAEQGWPTVDVFSYTAAGNPWIELRWLYCLGQYHVMEAFGPGGVETLKWLAIVAAFALVTVPVLRVRNLTSASATLALALLAASQRFYVRPELATYVFIGLFVLVLDRHRRAGGRWIWILPVLQVVWVNTHTLFVLGPALVGLLFAVETGRYLVSAQAHAAGGRRLVVIGGVLAASLLACFINPYGHQVLPFSLQLFQQIRGTVFKEAIGEFRSPFAFGTTYTAVLYYELLIALSALSALLNLRRLDPFWGLFWASQLYLSVLAIRNLPLFCLAAVPFIVSNLDGSTVWHHPAARRWLPWGRRAVAAAVVGLCTWTSLQLATDRFNVRQNDSNQFGVGIAEHRYPVKAVDFLDRQAMNGRVFGTMFESSYLLSRDRQVFIDPRLEVYGEKIFSRFLRIQRDAAEWREAVRQYDIRIVLVNLQAGLAGLVWGLPEWQLVYFDEVAAVFAREDVPGGPRPIVSPQEFQDALRQVRRSLPAPVRYETAGLLQRVSTPVPYLMLADFLLMCGQADAAEGFLRDAEAASPHLTELALRRVRLHELRAEWHGVIEEARAGLLETPGDPRLQISLGATYFRLNDLDNARLWLERSLERAPDRAKTWATLGAIHVGKESLPEAARCLERAVALAPGDALYRGNLARVQARLGRPGDAIAGLEAALELAPRDLGLLRDLALLHAATGDESRARHYLERGLELAPGDPKLTLLERQLGGR